MIVIWVCLDILAAPGPTGSPTPLPGTLNDEQFQRVLLVAAGIVVGALLYLVARHGGRRD